MQDRPPYITRFSDPESVDIAKVGGKNASLGEMTRKLEQVASQFPPASRSAWRPTGASSSRRLVEQFAERFDGFSIGSNDLTQLTLGVTETRPDSRYSSTRRIRR